MGYYNLSYVLLLQKLCLPHSVMPGFKRLLSLSMEVKVTLHLIALLVMRLHHLWPRKSQYCTIPVNLEAIWTTTITSKLFQTLYLDYSWVLHYTVYGLWLSNFDISSASSDLSTIFKNILKKLNYLWSPQSSTGTASYDLGLQLQHIPSISSVPSDGLKLNRTGSVSFDSVFSRYHGLFQSSVILTPISAQLQHTEFCVPWLDFLGHHSIPDSAFYVTAMLAISWT